MNDKKYKILNNNSFAVGIQLQNPQREQNIMPKSFALLTIDEIAYVDSVSKLFKRGMLVSEDNEINEMLGYVEVNKNVISDNEITTLLKGNFQVMKKRFEEITEIYAKSRIIEIFKKIGADLPMKKGKWLRNYFGKELFFDEIE